MNVVEGSEILISIELFTCVISTWMIISAHAKVGHNGFSKGGVSMIKVVTLFFLH
jgi:hypothetical protein